MTKATYACGHWQFFRHGAPKKGDRLVCRSCLQDTKVVGLEHMAEPKPKKQEDDDED